MPLDRFVPRRQDALDFLTGVVTAGVLTAMYTVRDRPGDYYLDAPGIEDDRPVRHRLINGLRNAVNAGRQLYRESNYPKVEVNDWPKMQTYATVNGERLHPSEHEGRYGHD